MKTFARLAAMAAVLGIAVCATQAEDGRRPAPGPLRVHPANPRYFTDGTKMPDGTLRAVYLTGSHHWDNLQDGYNPEVTPFDYERYLDLLEKHGHNFIRLWAWEHMTSEVSWHYEHKKQQFDPLPYQRTGPGLAVDGKPRADLRTFDPDYFERLRRRAEQAGRRGMYVGIMLFQGVASNGPRTWPGHVFSKDNNINGIDGGGIDAQRLKFPAVTGVQKAYICRVIGAVNDLDNVLYEIANEAHASTAEWQYEMIRHVKDCEAQKPRQHPVGMTCRADEPDNEVLFLSPADWVSPGTHEIYARDPPAADGRKVSLLDTDHVFGVGGDGDWIWRAFTRGHNPIYMDPLWGHVPDKGPWKGHARAAETARAAMGHSRRFAERMNLAAMTPQKDLASTGYCLAHRGRQCLVYQPAGGAFEVTLDEGRYEAEWFNPALGTSSAGGTVLAEAAGAVLAEAGGTVPAEAGKRRFTPPFSGPAVLYLRRQPAGSGNRG